MNNTVGTGHDCLCMALVILFILITLRASAMEILLTTQQPFILDNNTTLVIEDANSQQGVIWLKLYGRMNTIDSAVVRLGEHLNYGGKNITFYKIYSGGDDELMALKIENETIDGNASQRSMADPVESLSQRYLPSV